MSGQTHMRGQAKGSLTGLLFVALIAAIGAYIVYAGLGKLGRSPNDAPGWVLVVAGAAFLFAAASAGLNAAGWFFFGAKAGPDGALTDAAPAPLRLVQMLLSLGIVALLATVATWVALNPGDGSAMRRIVFGFSAVMTWGILLGFAIWKLRKPRK